MENVQSWAIDQWKGDIRKKLKDGKCNSRKWWKIIKEKQGETRDSVIPPLTTKDGEHLLTSKAKAEHLAKHFSLKMKVNDPERKTTRNTLTNS